MYYIYKFLNKNNQLIYIGKTIEVKRRYFQHLHEGGWKKSEISKILYAECLSKSDMNIYEYYYINKLKPLYNKSLVNIDMPTIILPELEFKPYYFSKNPKKRKIGNKNIDKFLPREQDIFLYANEKVPFLNSTYDSNQQSVRYYFADNSYCIITGEPWTDFEKSLFLLILTKSHTMEINTRSQYYTYTFEYKDILNNFNFINSEEVYNFIIASLKNIMNHNVEIVQKGSTLYSRVVGSLSFSKYGIDILSTDIQVSIYCNNEVFKQVYIEGFKEYN